ncbi:MAG: IS1634 family transposase, partial [Comamonadaceae bacterium]|nr:IS1634 family transposase [Comamonadaceae bacterium]
TSFSYVLLRLTQRHRQLSSAPLMFADTDQQAKATRDPVAPAVRSAAALTKLARLTLDDGTPAHSFCTLMAELATIVRNTCRTPQAAPGAPTFEVITSPNAKQQRALELLRLIKV